MLRFKLDSSGPQKMFGELSNVLANLRPAMRKVSNYQLKEVDKQFDSEGRRINREKWHKLAKKTVEQRLRLGFGAGPILKRTGKLKRSNHVSQVTNRNVRIANRAPYFKYHQKGTAKMPQRQIFGHSSKMKQKALDIVADHIIQKIKISL